jgi:eukaryotic-like serine/threonine-protein kinase
VSLTTGTRIGSFEIVAPLGAGGMGEVYRARDAKLGRDVALKILPPSVAADAERLARFRREARVLATLNHPHIGAIYGFEEASGIHALVLELVDGETLAARIAGDPLPVDDAVAIARQIALALDAAHEAGIVHRDLKPANIMVRSDGTVKILDFGLAKAFEAEATGEGTASTITSVGSRTGMIVGTPAYMSPEQARGQTFDKRADIWAFGCVLFEMLTARRAFDGSTVSDTIVAVLARDPDWTALPAATPAAVRRLIARCLDRDPKRRLRDIGDALPDLESPADEAEQPRRRGARLWTAWAVAAIAVMAAIALVLSRRAPASPLETLVVERLTYDSGLTTTPAISPDGNFVAYASDRAGSGDLDIWVQRSSGGEPLRLTDDPAEDRSPDFSPDGSQVVFRSERAGGGIYSVPSLGGPARLVVGDGRSPRFSPDGKQIAYWSGHFRGHPGATLSAVFVLPLAGGTPRRLVPDFYAARYPVWSPDGRALLVLGRPATLSPSDTDWWWVPADGGKPAKTGVLQLLNAPVQDAIDASWRPSGALFAANGDLFEVEISAAGRAVGPPRRLTAGAGRAHMPKVSRDGVIVFAAVGVDRLIERSPSGEGAPVVLYSDGRSDTRRASVSADGSIIVFERWYERHGEIWQKNVRTGQQQFVTRVDDSAILNATVSPDGRRLVYTVNGDAQPGTGTGYVQELSGGTPKKVCDACTLFGGFLADNHRALAVAARVIEIIDTRDGARAPLLRVPDGGVHRPHVSPDERWLAFRRETGTEAKTYVVPLSPGRQPAREQWQRVDEPTTTGRPTGWSLDSRTLYLLLDTDGFRCLWAQHVDPVKGLVGKPVAARHFHYSEAGGVSTSGGISTSAGNAMSADGFVYERYRITGNIWRALISRRN